MDGAPASLDLASAVAADLGLPAEGVAAVLRLLDEGNTVPFLARYRREATGELGDAAIRAIAQRAAAWKELDLRRRSVREAIAAHASSAGGARLAPELARAIAAASTRSELEDLQLPFRPRHRTRAVVARERGLEPLAQKILAQPESGDPRVEAAAFVSAEKGVADADAALQGARDVVAETIAEDAALRRLVRGMWYRDAFLVCERVDARTPPPARFDAFYGRREKAARMPAHRLLAVRRGEHEGALHLHLEADETRILPRLESAARLSAASPFAGELRAAIEDGYRRLLQPSIETELRVELKQRADELAVELFAGNLRDLLLAPPLGAKPLVGIDPAARSGCRCAAVDASGKYLGALTVRPRTDEAKAKEAFGKFLLEHRPAAIAVGHGIHGRETEAFVRRWIAEIPDLKATIVALVSEAGVRAWATSAPAKQELPKVDAAARGAVSIARRMQDPIAELVKVEPKAIGAGQHQHDLHAPMLSQRLDEVIEGCVNHVGVDLNSAAAPLLARVAGVGPALAAAIVRHREEKGPFQRKGQLLEVAGIAPKTFEQCAGFLRVRGGDQPLDGSAIHPERHRLVERMAADLGVPLAELVGSAEQVARIDPARYAGVDVGEPTLRDVLDELRQPGRDPRRPFEPPRFREDVTRPEDLKPGMVLEGVVTNVTTFGAFVDIGVHQDGLVHVSRLADRFVKDPREVVNVGDRLEVKVVEVDVARQRIALTAKKDAPRPEPKPEPRREPKLDVATAPRDGERPAPRPGRDGERRRDAGPRRDGRGRERDERAAHARAPLTPPPPRPLTPQDALKQGRNNPLGALLKDLFDKK